MTRRDFLKLALASGVAGLAGVPIVNTYRPERSYYRTTLAGLSQPLRLVQLSDLHYGPFIAEESVAVWVDRALEENADLIVITGDFIDRVNRRDLEPLFTQLARLKAPLGVYGVWGNHDVRYLERHPAAAALFAEHGIVMLKNENVRVRADLLLAGLDDYRTGISLLRPALDGMAEGATVLLSHNPDILPHVPNTVGLTLCGHTHGAQVKLPFITTPPGFGHYDRRFERGWVSAPSRAYVSRGLGVTSLPIRLNSPPEWVVFDLEPL